MRKGEEKRRGSGAEWWLVSRMLKTRIKGLLRGHTTHIPSNV